MTLPKVFQALGMTTRVFQAPIGGIASAELAAAVSDAGGLGHLACTWRSPQQLSALFEKMRRLTAKPFAANFVLDFPVDAQIEVALSHKVGAVSFFWGDGARFVESVAASGAVSIQVVGSVEEAKRAAGAGFDLIVAQGYEAGGHVYGDTGLFALLPQVVDGVAPIPVLAAGAIADARGVRAALALGAEGVWVGTRFLCSKEANIHPIYRDKLLSASAGDTIYSKLFDIGWPAAPLRSLRNTTTRDWLAAARPSAPNRPREGEIIARRADGSGIPRYHFGSPTSDVTGNAEAMALYAGQGVGLVQSVSSAAEIVCELAGDT